MKEFFKPTSVKLILLGIIMLLGSLSLLLINTGSSVKDWPEMSYVKITAALVLKIILLTIFFWPLLLLGHLLNSNNLIVLAPPVLVYWYFLACIVSVLMQRLKKSHHL